MSTASPPPLGTFRLSVGRRPGRAFQRDQHGLEGMARSPDAGRSRKCGSSRGTPRGRGRLVRPASSLVAEYISSGAACRSRPPCHQQVARIGEHVSAIASPRASNRLSPRGGGSSRSDRIATEPSFEAGRREAEGGRGPRRPSRAGRRSAWRSRFSSVGAGEVLNRGGPSEHELASITIGSSPSRSSPTSPRQCCWPSARGPA